MTHYKLVFLILNYKSYPDTIRLVNEILNERYDDSLVLVVDNDSPNDSYERIKESFADCESVLVVESGTNGGYAKGNNFGLRFLESMSIGVEYVCILNNDVHFSKHVIDSLITKYECIPDVAMMAPIQVVPGGNLAYFHHLEINTLWEDCISFIYPFKRSRHEYYPNTEYAGVQKVGIIPGAFCMVNYQLFKSIGFYDEETFLFCEERCVAKKFAAINKSNYVLLDTFYVHEHSKTINTVSSRLQQMKYLLDSRVVYTNKYRRNPNLCSFLLKVAYLIGCSESIIISKISSIKKSIIGNGTVER